MPKKNKHQQAFMIVSPGAGNRFDIENRLNLAADYLQANGLKVEIALANKLKEKATTLARRAVRDGYKTVIVMGGDGTVEAAMRGMLGSKSRLGIIPFGENNNIANSLGIPQGLEEACALIASEHTCKLDMGQVTTDKGQKFLFFEMATIGFAALPPAAKRTDDGDAPGLKISALTFMRPEARPKALLLLDKETKIEVETMLVMLSNAPDLEKNPLDVSGAKGLLDISIYPGPGKAELLRYYATTMDDDSGESGPLQHYQARKVKVKTSPRLKVVANGFVVGSGTVTIKVRKAVLNIIAIEKSRNAFEANLAPSPIFSSVGGSPRDVRLVVPG